MTAEDYLREAQIIRMKTENGNGVYLIKKYITSFYYLEDKNITSVFTVGDETPFCFPGDQTGAIILAFLYDLK